MKIIFYIGMQAEAQKCSSGSYLIMLALVEATQLKTGRATCSFPQHRLCRNRSAASGSMAKGGTADSYTYGNGNAKQHFPTAQSTSISQLHGFA